MKSDDQGNRPSTPAALTKGPAWLESLRSLTPEDRYEKIHGLVADKVAEICGLSSVDELDDTAGFTDLGMDSLMGFELESHLEDSVGIRLDDTVVMNHPNVSSLSRYLTERLFPSESANEPVAGTTEQSANNESGKTIEAGISEMSDAEVKEAIRAELEAAEKIQVRSS